MTKAQFDELLRAKLSGMPESDIERSVEFYNEMIDDRMDDGCSEEDAVAAIGSPDDVISDVLADTPLPRLIRERVRPRRSLSAWDIILLVIGSPLWLSIIIALAAVIASVYISLWAVIVSLYAAALSLAVAAIASVGLLILFAIRGSITSGIFILGCGIACAGLAILTFMLSNRAAKGAAWLGKKMLIGIKRCFVGKEKMK